MEDSRITYPKRSAISEAFTLLDENTLGLASSSSSVTSILVLNLAGPTHSGNALENLLKVENLQDGRGWWMGSSVVSLIILPEVITLPVALS